MAPQPKPADTIAGSHEENPALIAAGAPRVAFVDHPFGELSDPLMAGELFQRCAGDLDHALHHTVVRLRAVQPDVRLTGAALLQHLLKNSGPARIRRAACANSATARPRHLSAGAPVSMPTAARQRGQEATSG